MNGEEYRWHYDYVRLACDSGFSFHALKSKSILHQNLIQLDIEQLVRDKDVATIERYINTVAEFNLDGEQIKILDPGFVKVFQITQLAVQYLLFCKKYLDNTVVLIRNDFQKNNEETKNLKRYVEELKLENNNAKKQIKDLKQTLSSQIANQNHAIFQCNECPKAFSTEEYLLAHIKRRHDSNKETEVSKTSFQVETDKLQLEIKELKERLNNTEKFIQNDDIDVKSKYANNTYPKVTIENTYLTDLQHKFELLKSHVEHELRILQTQKFDQEKYEKWFETFLHQLGSTHAKEEATRQPEKVNTAQFQQPFVCTKCQNCNCERKEQNKIVRRNSTTQTLSDDTSPEHSAINKSLKNTTVAKAVQLQPVTYSYKETYDGTDSPEADNRLDKFEEIIQEKVSGSIEKLENQMQSFMNKMNEIEKQTKHNKELIVSEHQNPKNANLDTVIETLYMKPKNRVNKKSKAVVINRRASITSDEQSVKTKAPKQKIIKTTHITVPKSSIIRSNDVNSFQRKASLSESDSESEISDDSSSNESSEDEDDNLKSNGRNRKVISDKPSNISTLGKRSLTSLKEVAFTPEILNGLQKEIENVLNDRLEELGVSPDWTSLPVRSYQRAMNIVNHQASLIQKNIPNYMQIRSQILKAVDNQLSINNQNNAAPAKYSKLKSLISNVKSKTKVIRKAKEKENKMDVVRAVPMKSDVEKRHNKIETVHLTPKKKAIVKESPLKLKPLNKPESPLTIEPAAGVKLGAPSMQMYITDSDTETSTKNEIADATKTNDNDDKETDLHKPYNDVIQELNSTFSLHHNINKDSISDISNNEPKNPPQIQTVEINDHNIVEQQSKSVLKSLQPIGSTLQKKKVLFNLESSYVSAPDRGERQAVLIKGNDGDTTSIASSILDGPKLNKAEEAKHHKQDDEVQQLSDISDWDISELN